MMITRTSMVEGPTMYFGFMGELILIKVLGIGPKTFRDLQTL